MDIYNLSLRERKHAKTKLALLDGFINQLKSISYDDISVKDVCQMAEVSEATFFNYFPQKIDVLDYYRALSCRKIIWCVDKEGKGLSSLERIELIFELFTRQHIEPRVLHQLMAVYLREDFCRKEECFGLSDAEILLAFPLCEGILETRNITFDTFFEEELKKAIENKELPESTIIKDVLFFLWSILLGMIIAIDRESFQERNTYYKKHLSFLWKGIKGIYHE